MIRSSPGDGVDLRMSTEPNSADILFVQRQDIELGRLRDWQFEQLIEVDSSFSAANLAGCLRGSPPVTLRVDISTLCAYQLRLSKFFLGLLTQRSHPFSPPLMQQFDLPLHEAITNAVIHGNLELQSSFSDLESMQRYSLNLAERLQQPQYANRRVTLTAQVEARRILVSVTDQGPGHHHAFPAGTVPSQPHGRGLLIISEQAELVGFEDEGRTSKLAFHFSE